MVWSAVANAQGDSHAGPPPDPWPRVVDLSNGQVLVYQPQINKWVDNQLEFRAALAIKRDGAKDETFGVIFAAARTQVVGADAGLTRVGPLCRLSSGPEASA